MPNSILLGTPGANKGTQARMLAEKFGLLQLSTGDLLRKAAAKGAPVGKAAQEVMDADNLVSDNNVTAVVSDQLDRPDVAQGVIFEGFPPTVGQAKALAAVLSEESLKRDIVVSLDVQDEAVIERISGRYTCATCGETLDRYRKVLHPPCSGQYH